MGSRDKHYIEMLKAELSNLKDKDRNQQIAIATLDEQLNGTEKANRLMAIDCQCMMQDRDNALAKAATLTSALEKENLSG